jgi:hypothetical protein
VAGRDPSVLLVHRSSECTPPYLSTGISNPLQLAQAVVALGQHSTYVASVVIIYEGLAERQYVESTVPALECIRYFVSLYEDDILPFQEYSSHIHELLGCYSYITISSISLEKQPFPSN